MQIRLQDLTRLGSLHYLYLQNNSISALEPGAFLSQGQLLELALNGNLIHLVTPDMFRGLEHLRILYLAGNQITRVQDYTFRGLQVSQLTKMDRWMDGGWKEWTTISKPYLFLSIIKTFTVIIFGKSLNFAR